MLTSALPESQHLRRLIVNSRQLAQVGLGLIGVWALLYALNGLMTLSAVLGQGESPGPVLLSIGVPVALMLGLSYVLVFHNSVLASAIAPDAGATIDVGASDLGRILVVLLGVMLLVEAIPGTLNDVLAYVAAGEYPNMTDRSGPLRGFIGHAAQIAIALVLVRRPGRLLDYARAGTPAR